MKLKEDLMLRRVADEWIIVPMGERLVEFAGMMHVNETGAFLWKLLETETTRDELLKAMLEEYDTTEEEGGAALDAFIEMLKDGGVLEEDGE